MATVYQQYLGQFPITTSDNGLTIVTAGGSNSIGFVTGLYFITGYSGEASNGLLCETIQNCIRNAAGSLSNNCNMTYNHTTGRVTVAFNGVTNIVWTHSPLQTILGFTGAQNSASSYTATYAPRYTWRPSQGPSDYPNMLRNLWDSEGYTQYKYSPSGNVYSVAGAVVYGARISYQSVPAAEAIRPESNAIYKSYQEFFEDVVLTGRRIRVYPDITQTNYSSIKDAIWGEEKVGALSKYCKRGQISGQYAGYWDIDLVLKKWIG